MESIPEQNRESRTRMRLEFREGESLFESRKFFVNVSGPHVFIANPGPKPSKEFTYCLNRLAHYFHNLLGTEMTKSKLTKFHSLATYGQ